MALMATNGWLQPKILESIFGYTYDRNISVLLLVRDMFSTTQGVSIEHGVKKLSLLHSIYDVAKLTIV